MPSQTLKASTTPVTKDWFMLGLVSGMGAAAGRLIVNHILYAAGWPTRKFASVSGSFVLGKKTRLWGLIPSASPTPLEYTVGYTSDIMLGGIFGTEMAFISAHTPAGHELWKGVVKGAVLGSSTLIIGKQLKMAGLDGMSSEETATMLGMTTLFGALNGIILGKYGGSLIAQSHPILTKEVTNEQFTQGRIQYDPQESTLACASSIRGGPSSHSQ